MRDQLAIACFTIMGWVGADGCGGNDASDRDDASVDGATLDDSKPHIDVNQDNVCSQIALVACYNLYRCCAEGQIENFLEVSTPRTHEECISDVTRRCEQRMAAVNASIAAGRVSFNTTTMNACLNALITPDDACSSVGSKLPWGEACANSPWIGTVPIGGTCHHGFECANLSNSFCSPNQTCTALPTEGMPCVNGGRCALGFYCGASICHAQHPATGPCLSDNQCLQGNYCNNAQPRVCAPVQGVDQPCIRNQSCDSNRCLPGVCSGSANSCFTNSDCVAENHCSNSNASCVSDASCGTGTCSIGGAPCTTANQCTGVGNTCQFPNQCILASCIGNIVCAAAEVEVNYCTDAV